LKDTSIIVYSVGFNSPYIWLIVNYYGNWVVSLSLYLIGMKPLFLNRIYFLAICLSKILVNLTGLPSVIYIWGLHPVHCKGITIGEGLSLIMIIN
jgi:hypothetical protein